MPTLTYQHISPRTGEALVCAAKGLTTKATARVMGCEPSTVASLRNNAMYKLRANNMVQAVSEAYKRGILTYVAIVLCFACSLGSPDQVRPQRTPVRPPSVLRVNRREV